MCVGHETGSGERGGDLNLMGKELTMEYVCMEAERGLTRRKEGADGQDRGHGWAMERKDESKV